MKLSWRQMVFITAIVFGLTILVLENIKGNTPGKNLSIAERIVQITSRELENVLAFTENSFRQCQEQKNETENFFIFLQIRNDRTP